jgi:hypothetical protein
MIARAAAQAVLVGHLVFILFAVFGGGLVLYRTRWAWLHLPALAWGLWIELSHGICPLTPLENRLRLQAGEAGYRGGFIEHYLIPLIYPAGLQPAHQLVLAALLGGFNLVVYGLVLWRGRRRTPKI